MSAKVFCSTILILTLFLATACTNDDSGYELLSGNDSVQEQGPGSKLGLENDGNSIIDSSGTMIPAPPEDNVPGAMNSSESGATMNQSVNWLIYTDKKFGFSIFYPDTYVVLDEIELLNDITPTLLHRVRFLDADLAKSDYADLEPPKFNIEIFENPSHLPLNQWLDVNSPSGTLEETKVDSVSCTRVTLAILLAPNQFYYCPWEKNVFKLTFLGPYSQEMLESFKFGH